MIPEDRQQFASILSGCMKVYNRKLDVAVMNIWMAALENYSIADITKAFNQYIVTGKFAPAPADIIEFLPDPFGHLSPEEAWNRVPKSGSDCAYVTNEMMQAAGACQDSIERGDLVAARLAFVEAYKKNVSLSRAEGKKAVYWPSLSTEGDWETRRYAEESATIEAAELGWIKPRQAWHRLEKICCELGKSPESVIKRLERLPGGDTLQIEHKPKSNQDHSKKIAGLIAMLDSNTKVSTDEN